MASEFKKIDGFKIINRATESISFMFEDSLLEIIIRNSEGEIIQEYKLPPSECDLILKFFRE